MFINTNERVKKKIEKNKKFKFKQIDFLNKSNLKKNIEELKTSLESNKQKQDYESKSYLNTNVTSEQIETESSDQLPEIKYINNYLTNISSNLQKDYLNTNSSFTNNKTASSKTLCRLDKTLYNTLDTSLDSAKKVKRVNSNKFRKNLEECETLKAIKSNNRNTYDDCSYNYNNQRKIQNTNKENAAEFSNLNSRKIENSYPDYLTYIHKIPPKQSGKIKKFKLIRNYSNYNSNRYNNQSDFNKTSCYFSKIPKISPNETKKSSTIKENSTTEVDIKIQKIFKTGFDKNLNSILKVKNAREMTDENVIIINKKKSKKLTFEEERKKFAEKNSINKKLIIMRDKVHFLKSVMDHIFPHVIMDNIRKIMLQETDLNNLNKNIYGGSDKFIIKSKAERLNSFMIQSPQIKIDNRRLFTASSPKIILNEQKLY